MDTTKSSAPAHPAETRLAKLEERYRYELMGEEERLELRERIVGLKRKVEEKAGRL